MRVAPIAVFFSRVLAPREYCPTGGVVENLDRFMP
jgi:hypothetical protein